MNESESLLRDALWSVTSGQSLTCLQAESVVACLMKADLSLSPFGELAAGLLCALKTRGESVDEIVGAARSLKQHQVGVETPTDGLPLLDTCGTGGDGAHLINISTLTALVAASLGVRVAKHGNRSASSSCGSADLLEAMDYPLSGTPENARSNLASTGFTFLFAPNFHPALKNLSALRKVLGVRTLFNLLGPLVNPAPITHQLLGVYAKELVEPLARACSELGLRRAAVVHGEGGLDELSPLGKTWVCLCDGEEISHHEWTPASFGAAPVPLSCLRGGGPDFNAQVAQRLLNGAEPEVASAVAMNAGAALWLVGSTASLSEGYQLAYQQLRSGQVGTYFEATRRGALALTETG